MLQAGGYDGGYSSATIWRFEAASGTVVGGFGIENEGYNGMSVTPDNQVYVADDILGGDDLHRFTRSGIYAGAVASGNGAWLVGVTALADGSLCCIRRETSTSYNGPFYISKLDRPGGSTLVANGAGGMLEPRWLIAGPDGSLYVLERDIGIMRYDAATGGSLGVFVPMGRGGLTTPARMAFGPDRNLYVSTGTGNSVLRYNGATGAFMDTFVSAGSGGLNDARGLAFGPDGNLYVASRLSHRILRYQGSSGAFVDAFVSDTRLRYPTDIGFTTGSQNDVVWFEDAAPAGASVAAAGWEWVPSAFSGTRALAAPGGTSYGFNFAQQPLTIGAGDTLVAYVRLPDTYGSSSNWEVMLSWFDGNSWEHRAYWGADLINEGQNGTAGRRYMGNLVAYAKSYGFNGWYRLEVPARLVGLEGRTIYGMGVQGPKGALFDRFGKATAGGAAPSGPDTTAPTVQIISPAANATVSGTVEIAVRASDNYGAAYITPYIDNQALRTVASDGNGVAFTWNTTAVGNGPHVLRAAVSDGAGNRAETSISVTVDNTSASWWLDDQLPAGAWGSGSGGDGWNWVTGNPAPVSGTRSHQSNLASGMHEHYFNDATSPLALGTNDLIVTYAYIDPANPPREIMLSFFDGASWEHRAYWGDDLITYGVRDTASRRRIGWVPSPGQWVRLEVPASYVGLAGKSISGVGFAAYDGRVTWDAFGRADSGRDYTPPTVAITSPASGATVSGTVPITATASDNERVGSVSFYVDNAYLGYDTEAPYTINWDSAVATNGTHTIRAVAADNYGNNAEHSITVTLNNDASATDRPPELRFTAPATTGALYGTVQVAVDAVDDHGIAWVQLQLPGQTSPGPRMTAPPYSVQWDTRTVGSGAWTISAWAADTHGQQVYRTLNVTVDHAASGDTAPPTIAFTAPASGATVSGNVTLTVNAADNYGISRVIYYHDGVSISSASTAPYSGLFYSTGTTNGAHTLQAVAYDFGGRTATATVTVNIDNSGQDYTAPSILISAPANDATVSGLVTIEATATDNAAIASVQFYLDGAVLQAADTAAPYAISWDSRSVADGSHLLSAIATDTGGRTSQRSIVTVNVNNAGTPPPSSGGSEVVWFDDQLPAGATVASSGGDGWNWITSNPTPTSGAKAHQSNLATGLHEHAFDWAYGGALAISATESLFAWVYLDPANPPREIMLSWRDDAGWDHRAYWGADLIGYGQNGTASRRRVGDLPSPGAWTKLLVPADAVGLGSSALLGMSFAAFDGRVTWDAAGKRGAGGDTTSPAVAITAPAAGANVSGTVTVAATASDNVGVVAVSFQIDGRLIADDTSAPFTVTWDSATVANGNHTLTAVARDAAGNRATSAPTAVNVSNGATDTTPPSISFMAPNSGATVAGTAVTISASAYDNVGVASVRFAVDGVSVGDRLTNPPFSLTWNSTTVANGSHTLKATAVDLSGNEASATQAVSVNNPVAPPSSGGDVVWIDDILPAGAVAGASGGDAWNWVTSNPPPASGSRAHQSAIASGLHEHFFGGASAPLHVDPTDTLVVYVYVDAANPPREIMLNWFGGSWEHRAYWGENLITYGTDRTASRFPMGALPAAGEWVRLEVPANAVGFTTATDITGMSFSLYGGRATWDRVGKRSASSSGADTTPPTAAVLAPAAGATVTGRVTIDMRFTDNVSVRRVAALVDGHEIAASNWDQATLGLGINWESSTVANGTHAITAQAWDAAGNTATSTAVTVTVSNAAPPPPTTGDTTAPTVALTAPANNATVAGNVTLSATATDNVGVAGVTFRVDGTDLATDATAPYSTAWNSTSAANGSHAITAVARDTSGNQATSATVIVSVNNAATGGAVIWMDSAVPANASTGASGGDAWTWVTSNPAPFAGTRVHQSAIAAGIHDHSFVGTTSPLQVFTGDTLFVYVYLDPANAPREVMLSFNDGTWEHRAYWGSNEIPYGEDGTNSRRNMGALPAAGQWVKLEIPARLVGLEGRSVNGMSFSLVGGRATWDIVGKSNP